MLDVAEQTIVVALTGTPGAGKTSVSRLLADEGYGVLALSRFQGDPRFDIGVDKARSGTVMLDEDALDEHLKVALVEEIGDVKKPSPLFIESHFAHALSLADRIIVLRCRPSILLKRLEARGYDEEKIRENLEAEGMDLILQEALQTREEQQERGRDVTVAEVDTTKKSAEETKRTVLRIATAKTANLEIGAVDWSDEVLGWY